jgi:hypothetical protein
MNDEVQKRLMFFFSLANSDDLSNHFAQKLWWKRVGRHLRQRRPQRRQK